jgi:hypothetical protein
MTKYLLSRTPPCFERYVNPLVSSAFAVVSTHQSALGPRCYGAFCLCVIHKAYACSDRINRLVMMTFSPVDIHTYITSRPFPIGVGRDHFLPLATILTHTFRFLHFHQIPHTRSPVKSQEYPSI